MRSKPTPDPTAAATQTGHPVQEKSPPEFFLQPLDMYPMAPQEFEKWLVLLREHFPDNWMLADVGARWYPAKSAPPRVARLPSA